VNRVKRLVVGIAAGALAATIATTSVGSVVSATNSNSHTHVTTIAAYKGGF
jgi:hypothetical protein